jgi:hypothetical protein
MKGRKDPKGTQLEMGHEFGEGEDAQRPGPFLRNF